MCETKDVLVVKCVVSELVSGLVVVDVVCGVVLVDLVVVDVDDEPVALAVTVAVAGKECE